MNSAASLISIILLLVSPTFQIDEITQSNDLIRYPRAPKDYDIHVTNCYEAGKTKNSGGPVFKRTDYSCGWFKNRKSQHHMINKYKYKFEIVQTVHKGQPVNKVIEKPPEYDPESNILIIPSYYLTPGVYKVTVTAKLKKKEPEYPENKTVQCRLKMEGVSPMVKINGGDDKLVPSHTPIILNGSESLNLNYETISNKDLSYTWTCTQKIKPPTICKGQPISYQSTYVIPAPLVKDGDEIIAKLTVTTTYGDTGSHTQKIKVENNVASLDITCEKNCPPVTDYANYKYLTFMRASCMKNCEGIKDEDYRWTIESLDDKNFKFNYNKFTDFGREIYKMVVKPNVLKPAKYSFTVELKPGARRKGRAKMIVHYVPAPEVEACYLKPNKGTTAKTYALGCREKTPGLRTFYELVSVNKTDPSDEELIISEKNPEIFTMRFHAPPSEGRWFVVRTSLLNGLSTERRIPVDIKPVLKKNSSPQQIEAVINGRYENLPSIRNLMHSANDDDRLKGFAKLKSLIAEVTAIPGDKEETVKKINAFKQKLADDLFNSPLPTLTDVTHATEALVKLMQYGDEKSKYDPVFGKIVTTLCMKMLDKQQQALSRSRFPLNLSVKTKKLSSTVTKCFETNTNPNYDVVQPIDQNVTTPTPRSEEKELAEDYDNYVDFSDDYYRRKQMMQESTYNIINGTTSAAKMMAITTVVGEKVVEAAGKSTAIIVAKDIGRELAKKTVHRQGVSIVPSQDWNKSDHFFDILMSVWTKDVFWWNSAHAKVATNIANLQFWHSTCKDRILEFEKPVNVFFDIKRNSTFGVNVLTEIFRIPTLYTSMSDQELNYWIKVRRVTVPPGLTLHIQFYNLTKEDVFEVKDKYYLELDVLESCRQVVITKFNFPTMKDFKNGSLVVSSSNRSSFVLISNETSETWYYLGLLLPNQTYNSTEITYKISFRLALCVRWNMTNTTWVPACKPGSLGNTSVINCECNNFSVLAGYIQNLKSVQQEVLLPEIELELQATSIIFIVLLVTVLLYCILALFAIQRRQQGIYFLADNDIRDRFAYLVTVQSGTGRRSGTSANVTLRLIGKENSTEPHVLNYPDPAMYILQRYGEDMFVLSSEHHLGEVTGVEIWSDSLGPDPDWYCKEIRVYDLQLNEEWRFKVETRFCAFKGVNRVVAEQAKEASFCRKFLQRFRFSNRYHTWWLFHNDEHFSYLKKLTVLLSNLLTTYVTVLVLLGMPSFHIADVMDVPHYRVKVSTVFVAFIGSLPSFMFHSMVAWIFRMSKLQFSKYKQTGRMSFSVTLSCWILLVILIVASSTFLIICGFWIPVNKSLIWLTACGIGILFDIFVYESIFVFIQSFVCGTKMKVNYLKNSFQDMRLEIEMQRVYLYEKFGEVLLRPYFEHLYEPLSNPQIKEKSTRIRRRREIIAELEDLIMFAVYIIILYMVALSNKDRMEVLSKKELEDVIEGIHTRTIDFSGVETFTLMYEYLNKTLIPSIQPMYWYGNYAITEPGLMVDVSNKFFGVVRLRQHRMLTNVCRTVEPMRFLNSTCWPEFSSSLKETRSFGYGWGGFSEFFDKDRLRDIWKYQKKTGTLASFGKFAAYSGGGYVAYFGRTFHNSVANFRTLANKVWIDQRTRSVFIEFLVYNVNVNVFNSIKLLFEQSATGFTYNTYKVQPVRMLFVANEMQQVLFFIFIFFITWVGLLFVKQSLGLLRNFRTFHKDAWFTIDLIIVTMSVVTIAVFHIRTKMVGQYLASFTEAKRNDFLSYFHLFYIEDFLTAFAAALVCIATIRLWKFLRFGLMFRILERTLVLCLVPLLSVIFVFFFVSVGTAIILVLLYGNEQMLMSQVVRVSRMLMTLCLKPSEVNAKMFVHHVVAAFVFAFYAAFATIMYFVIIMIIVMAYSDAQLEYSSLTIPYNIKHYVLELREYLPRFVKFRYLRQRGGEETNDKVEAKADKFLYSNCLSMTTRKMLTMAFVTRGVVRNIKNAVKKGCSERDYELMAILVSFYLKRNVNDGEVDVFFKGRVKGRRIKIINEERVELIANVVNLMLQEKEVIFDDEGIKDSFQCDRWIKGNQECIKTCDKLLKVLLHKINIIDIKMKRIMRTRTVVV